VSELRFISVAVPTLAHVVNMAFSLSLSLSLSLDDDDDDDDESHDFVRW